MRGWAVKIAQDLSSKCPSHRALAWQPQTAKTKAPAPAALGAPQRNGIPDQGTPRLRLKDRSLLFHPFLLCYRTRKPSASAKRARSCLLMVVGSVPVIHLRKVSVFLVGNSPG